MKERKKIHKPATLLGAPGHLAYTIIQFKCYYTGNKRTSLPVINNVGIEDFSVQKKKKINKKKTFSNKNNHNVRTITHIFKGEL